MPKMLRVSPRRRAFTDFVKTTPEISRSLAEENKDIASMDKLLRVVSASENVYLAALYDVNIVCLGF